MFLNGIFKKKLSSKERNEKKMKKQSVGLLFLIMLLLCAVSSGETGLVAGDRVSFGKYPQRMKSQNVPADPEPIIWQVLAADGEKVLLLAERGLAGKPYNSKDHFLNDVTWETCSLRTWLNNDFLTKAFSEEEQRAIQLTTLSTPDYKENGFVVSGGNNTVDKIYLLSPDELGKYLRTDASRICSPTQYAVYTGAGSSWYFYNDDSLAATSRDYNDVCNWWLRSPGEIGHFSSYCRFDGYIDRGGHYSGEKAYSVRPALWVNRSALAGKIQ